MFTLFSCWFCKSLFHLTANGYESFNLIISSFNRGFFFTFRISQLHFVYTCLFLGAHFDFVAIILPLFFFPISSSFLLTSYVSRLTLISQLLSTCCDIWVPITSRSSSLNNWKLLKFLLPNEGLCNPNWVDSTSSKEKFGSIVEFRNHFHLARSMPS